MSAAEVQTPIAPLSVDRKKLRSLAQLPSSTVSEIERAALAELEKMPPEARPAEPAVLLDLLAGGDRFYYDNDVKRPLFRIQGWGVTEWLPMPNAPREPVAYGVVDEFYDLADGISFYFTDNPEPHLRERKRQYEEQCVRERAEKARREAEAEGRKRLQERRVKFAGALYGSQPIFQGVLIAEQEARAAGRTEIADALKDVFIYTKVIARASRQDASETDLQAAAQLRDGLINGIITDPDQPYDYDDDGN